MSIPSISEARLEEIRKAVGSPSDGDLGDYEKRLKEETAKDGSLERYLEWIVEQDVKELPCESPERWLSRLCRADFSEPWEVIDLRSALSFGEVNYLPFTVGNSANEIFIISPDPASLGPSQTISAETLPSLTNVDSQKIHPALIQLSVDNAISTGGKLPTFALPIGRLDRIIMSHLLSDHEIVETVASQWEKSSTREADVAIAAFGELGLVPNSQNPFSLALYGYMDTIIKTLNAGSTVQQLRYSDLVEQSRCRRWRIILQNSKLFKETNFVVVVDAEDSSHPVWLIHKHDREDEVVSLRVADSHDGKSLLPAIDEHFDTAYYVMTAAEWSNSSHEIGPLIARRIRESMVRGKINVHAADMIDYNQRMAMRNERLQELQQDDSAVEAKPRVLY